MARLTIEALLGRSIDYAGLFPPASLSLEGAVTQFRGYRAGAFGFLLGRFIVAEKDLDAIPPDLDGHLAVLSERDCARASVIETKSVRLLSKPTYCEVPIELLPAVAEAASFAKVRTGGVLPDAIPLPITWPSTSLSARGCGSHSKPLRRCIIRFARCNR